MHYKYLYDNTKILFLNFCYIQKKTILYIEVTNIIIYKGGFFIINNINMTISNLKNYIYIKKIYYFIINIIISKTLLKLKGKYI